MPRRKKIINEIGPKETKVKNELAKSMLRGMDRQARILELLRDDPSLTNEHLATMLGVNMASIIDDLKKIANELKDTNIANLEVQRDRLLREIRMNKIECMRRLRTLNESQGARWMEEWTKLTEKEMRILGVGNTDTLTIERGKSFDKADHEAAILAMLKVNPNKIDLQIEEPVVPEEQILDEVSDIVNQIPENENILFNFKDPITDDD